MCFLALIAFVSIFPFYIMIIMSTSSTGDIINSLRLLPSDMFLHNAKIVFDAGFAQFYFNSILVAASSAVLGVLMSAMAGYGLAKYSFRFRGALYNFLIIILMIPLGISVVGYLIEMKDLRLANTFAPIILMSAVTPFGTFLLTQFMKDSTPSEIIESARMDGAGEFRIFSTIALPLSVAGCVTLFLLVFMNNWNSFLIPLIFINKKSMITVPLGIYAIGNNHDFEYGARVFALFIGTIPLMIVFAARLQKNW